MYTGNSGTSYSVTNPNASSHAIIDSMYILEWNSGAVGATASAPSAMVLVSNAIGGDSDCSLVRLLKWLP